MHSILKFAVGLLIATRSRGNATCMHQNEARCTHLISGRLWWPLRGGLVPHVLFLTKSLVRYHSIGVYKKS